MDVTSDRQYLVKQILTSTHTPVLKVITCPECQKVAASGIVATRYTPGLCIQFNCPCHTQPWFMCVICVCRLNRAATSQTHFQKSQKHQENWQSLLSEFSSGVVSLDSASVTSAISVARTASSRNLQTVAMQLLTVVAPLQAPLQSIPVHVHTPTTETLHLQALQEIFFLIEKAQTPDLINPFMGEKCMLFFHVAELAAVGNGGHGGVRHLVTKSFMGSNIYTNDHFADIHESIWHFHCFVQYVSMTEEQRTRQGRIVSHKTVQGLVFPHTHVLEHKEMNKFYGRSNQNTIWNNLPIPTVDNIGGIAYVSPMKVIIYLMANSIEVDPFTVQDNQGPVFHVSQSKYAKDWHNQLQQKHPGVKGIMLWVTDWRDGFGANRTKSNRKSTVAWTFSVATPRDRINAIDNTRAVALGLKKNPNWPAVEFKFQEDMALFGNGLIPFQVYHGGLKKCIPVFVRRFACLTDKVERADYTSTLNCTSNYHRLFGYLLAFEKPPKNKINHASHLARHAEHMGSMIAGESDSTLKQYGWSFNLVDARDTTVGGLLPACYVCRKNNVDWLKAPTHPRVIVRCEFCANWAVTSVTKTLLKFPASEKYPPEKRCLPGCPILPPSGREAGLKYLYYLELDFDGMKQATRYAFYHTMTSKRNKGWTKAMLCEYLRACGVNAIQQNMIFNAAKKADREGAVIDWNANYGVGSYRFPAAWVGDIPIFLCIEMLMHLLFLGIASSNFDLCADYLTSHKQLDTFKKPAHSLLQILNKFNLSWLLAFPLSGNKLTTGTWVSENWLAWVRISKICYAFCVQEGVTDERKGCNDLLRMVTSFTALVSRVMSHTGSSDKSTDVLDAIVKEFLSSVREFHVLTTKGEDNQYWNKSNYVSLLNIVPTIQRLGPLTNFWDGGGKGERYIQEIKPHIPRGIRDAQNFFVRMLERVYKFDCITQIEKSMLMVAGTALRPESQPDPEDAAQEESQPLGQGLRGLGSWGSPGWSTNGWARS